MKSSAKPSAAQPTATPKTARLAVSRLESTRYGTAIARNRIRPPIVGVPAFAWCSCGPSSRICWPNSRTRRQWMNFGPEEDRDQHRRHPGDQHLAAVDRAGDDVAEVGDRHHQAPSGPAVAASSASANASSPTEREPLTRTASPSPSIPATSSAAAAGVGRPLVRPRSRARARRRRRSAPMPSPRACAPASRWYSAASGPSSRHPAEDGDPAAADRRATRGCRAPPASRSGWRCSSR